MSRRVRRKGDDGSRKKRWIRQSGRLVSDIQYARGRKGEVQRSTAGLVEANSKYRRQSLARSLLFKPAIRDIFTVYIRIYYKSLYHYNVGLEGRENVEDDSGNQHERKENNASEIVITKVNLDLLSRIERGEA